MAKKALLVGINRYRVPAADLRGCVNDVSQMRDVLTRFFGFSEGDITVLTDFEATKGAIQKGLQRLVSSARPGDVIFAHYSGHGSNVPDKSGDEADGRDEILCPTDLDWKDPLLDDWLRTLFDNMAKDVSCTFVADSCHSGTVTRAIKPPDTKDAIPRYLPCPLDLLATESGRELRGALRGGRRKMPSRDVSEGITDVALPEILIAACRDDQTSADAYIAKDYHGALTYALVDVITKARGKLTYRQLHERATDWLRGSYKQHPQLEGRTDAFDQQFLAPLA